jgi:CBS domain containing-hemolysin-like protein
MDLPATLILVAICIALEAFFSGAEIAMISASRIKIQHKAGKGDAASRVVSELLNAPDRLFTATSLGTNLAIVTATAVFTAYMIPRFGQYGDMLTMLLLSPVILFLGEVMPKVVFQNAADTLAPLIARPLRIFCGIFAPIVAFFTVFSDALMKKALRQTTDANAFVVSRDHIRQITHPDSPSDLDLTEKKLIHKIFNFGEITVEHCMVPLIQVYAIRDTATIEEAHRIANDSGFSRLPVYHKRMFNLIGILNTFDLLNAPMDGTPIDDLIRPAYYVPPNKKIDDLLKELQQRSLHMAFVVDEYGGCIGIITIEDLLEEIVGEIQDEYDEPEKQFEAYADGGYLIEAERTIDSINENLNLALPTGDYETIGGLVIDKLEKIPSAGDQVELNGYRLTVKEASRRKIYSVIVRKLGGAEG